MKKRLIVILSMAAAILLFSNMSLACGSTEHVDIMAVETMPEPQEPEVHIQVTLTEDIPEKQYRYIQGCPLDEEVQQGIFDICESYSISFEFVMAVIQKESSYRVDVVGDNGNSVGLMQVQERWHSELMEELGVYDLSDPLQNVEVGVAILAGYFEEKGDVYYALMAYNGGRSYAKKMLKAGKVSDYALKIVETANEYTEQNE